MEGFCEDRGMCICDCIVGSASIISSMEKEVLYVSILCELSFTVLRNQHGLCVIEILLNNVC